MLLFWGCLGGEPLSEELKINSVNQIIKGTDIYVRGNKILSIGLVVKGRIRINTEGINVVVGSGSFLGLCDLPGGEYKVTYTADSDAIIYAFPAINFNQEVRALIKVNNDYAGLMFSTLSKYIRELSKVYDTMKKMAFKMYDFLKSADENYREIAQNAGIRVSQEDILSGIKPYDTSRDAGIDSDKIIYYKACCDIPSDVLKKFLDVNVVMPVYHIIDETRVVNFLVSRCTLDVTYLKNIAGPLIINSDSIFSRVLQLATALKNMDAEVTDVLSLFDDVVDHINTLDKFLYDKACVDAGIDHEYMENSYFTLINGGSVAGSGEESSKAGEEKPGIKVLDGALDFILSYSGVDSEIAKQFRDSVIQFANMPDKMASDDNARGIRRGVTKHYYDIYRQVFLKDYQSSGSTPVVIDLFLRYGFLSEKLITDEMKEELLSLNDFSSDLGLCKVYNMKEWLTEIYEGRKEPSKNEFDMDYFDNLRDMRKTGRISVDEELSLSRDTAAKFDYEIQNMFKTNHRLIFGQVSVFVPFLYTEGCTGSFKRCILSKDKINISVNKLLHIDYSAFYRESLYSGELEKFRKEYIMEEVFPDFIVFPTFGSNGIMWQELSGRKRNTKGRFLLPAFMDTDIDSAMIKLFGRFRWELCRTMQGASWNNIQLKSLTSEYSDFVQFYRKNRELSDDKKEKLKMQIKKCRNNTREVFVIDYENWIKHEANGGLCLSKPVREILATYCPFTKELREKVGEQPLYQEAMTRFMRERGKKLKEYDLRFRVWQKDKLEIPKEISDTRDFYANN